MASNSVLHGAFVMVFSPDERHFHEPGFTRCQGSRVDCGGEQRIGRVNVGAPNRSTIRTGHLQIEDIADLALEAVNSWSSFRVGGKLARTDQLADRDGTIVVQVVPFEFLRNIQFGLPLLEPDLAVASVSRHKRGTAHIQHARAQPDRLSKFRQTLLLGYT